jgi:hypothetical protein
MTDTVPNERVDEFRAEIAGLKIKDPSAARDVQRLRLGGILMLAGPVLGLVAFFMSHGSTDPLAQRDAIVLGLLGVGLAVAGSALFVRYSFAQFMRFWLARLLYERSTRP